jgi:hypothetical protein
MKRGPVLSCVVLLSAAPALAQAQAPADWGKARAEIVQLAQRELRTGVARDVAWGAFRAGEYRLSECTPDLLAALDAPPQGDRLEQHAMLAALLDAAVQLRADVPPGIVRRYWDQWPVQAAILFSYAKSPDRDAVLLELLRSARGLRWHAAANMLLLTRAPGFAAHLLSELRLVMRVTVSDEGNTASGGGTAGVSVGDGIGVNPSGFPPFAMYRFEIGATAGDVVLVSGPRTVYYSRTVEYRYQFGVSTVESGFSDANPLAYVLQLTGSTESLALSARLRPSTSLAWKSGEQVVRDVAAARAELTRAYGQLVAALQRAKRLTADEAQRYTSPTIEVVLTDARTDRSQPLPQIE